MKRTAFNDPRPVDHAEMMEVFDETEISAVDCYATVEYEDHNDGFGETGWTADVYKDEDGDEVFSTRAYKDKDDLISDLKACGITQIEVPG